MELPLERNKHKWNLTGRDMDAAKEDGTNIRRVQKGVCVCVCACVAAHNLCARFIQFTGEKKTGCLCYTPRGSTESVWAHFCTFLRLLNQVLRLRVLPLMTLPPTVFPLHHPQAAVLSDTHCTEDTPPGSLLRTVISFLELSIFKHHKSLFSVSFVSQ